MARLSPTRRFKTIFRILERQFGVRAPYRTRAPVEQALITILIKAGSENPADRALKRLQKQFVDLNEMRVCDPKLLDDMLGNGYPQGTGGLIKDTLTAIFNHAQAMTLDDIITLDPTQAEVKLRKMEVMPSRVSGELLLATLDYRKLPESSGLLRVACRTGLVPQSTADRQIATLRRLACEKHLAARCPPRQLVPRVFHAFSMLAERVCTEKGFTCRVCPVKALCPTGIETLKQLGLDEAKRLKQEKAAALQAAKHHEHKAKEHRRAAGEKLKKALQVRRKGLNRPADGKARHHAKPAAPAAVTATRMMQTSSADIRRHHRLKKRPQTSSADIRRHHRLKKRPRRPQARHRAPRKV